jgi:c-di-GMP-binding flagellar brake protein YcgR
MIQLFAKSKSAEVVDFAAHFAVNDPVRLEIRGRLYTSRVEDLLEDSLWIGAPLAGVRMVEGDTFKLVSSVRAGMQGYRVRVAESTEGPPTLLRVVPFQSLGKSQLRDYARVPDMLHLKFRVLDARAKRGMKSVEATTRNISGGGLLVLVAREDRPLTGEEIEIELSLSSFESVRCRGIAIRIDPIENIHDTFEMAVRFTNIDEEERKRIIRRVYTREAELRRAGLM